MERQVVERLALKYRPAKFGDIVEQDHPKRILSQLIVNSQSCANILLHGSIGSGKTSLVRIYAKALNCDFPTSKGEPCLACEPCRAIDKGDESRFVELDAPRFPRLSDVKDKIGNLLASDVKPGQRRVIFIDEAHSLSHYPDSYDFLLKRVEEPPPGVSFCFATTAVDRIKPALRSRLISLEVRPLSHDSSVEFLSDIGRKEGLSFSTEAISLLAGLGEHQPRNMLQALDQMRIVDRGNEITRERVAKIFGVDYIENLVWYFEALGSGDVRRQIETFFAWREPVKVRVRLIQLLLVGMYYQDLCGVNVSIDPVVGSIRPAERDVILSAFRQRLGALDLRAFWQDMLSAWPVITAEATDAALLAHVIRLQDLANRSEFSPRTVGYVDRVAAEPMPVMARSGSKSQRVGSKGDDVPKDPLYLNRKQVAGIFASASFLIQEGMQPFNAQITIRHRLFGVEEQSKASEHFAEFSKALKSRLEHWNGVAPRLFVQERSEDDGSCGRVIAFIPDAADAARWIGMWQRSARVDGREDEAVRLDVLPARPGLGVHWTCVRWLCGGFNPIDPVFAELGIEPEFQRVAGDIGKRTRFGYSDLIGPAAIAKSQEGGLELVSAFDDRQWGRLYDGWELNEGEDRSKHNERLGKAIAQVEIQHPEDGSAQSRELREYELRELRAGLGARVRKRSWQIWDEPS